MKPELRAALAAIDSEVDRLVDELRVKRLRAETTPTVPVPVEAIAAIDDGVRALESKAASSHDHKQIRHESAPTVSFVSLPTNSPSRPAFEQLTVAQSETEVAHGDADNKPVEAGIAQSQTTERSGESVGYSPPPLYAPRSRDVRLERELARLREALRHPYNLRKLMAPENMRTLGELCRRGWIRITRPS